MKLVRGGAYLGVNEGTGRRKSHSFSSVHRVTQTYTLYFLTAYKMTSSPSVLAGTSDSKNPDPYYDYSYNQRNLLAGCEDCTTVDNQLLSYILKNKPGLNFKQNS